MSGRGVSRRSKAKRPYVKVLTEEDKMPEPLDTLTEKKVQSLENKAVGYLEDELKILTSTPGNFSEVARILKILKDYQASTKKGGKGASVRSESSEKIESWSLDD
tara:strand:+ start:398 stop:712 length:315 start_codon:yes stop_codon:yes gene_type:complete